MNQIRQTAEAKIVFYAALKKGVTETRREYLQAIFSELVETDDDGLLDLICRLLIKSKNAALHATNTKDGAERFSTKL